ncbi:MAG: hypothetical protein JWN39_2327 [Ilumatobacteraceae bacterium]|nr:hypothetical protein [Ilumatobacteraceae bacterium]
MKPYAIRKVVAFFKSKNRVLVLGSTGVGKSELALSLTNLLPETISYLDRTAFAKSDDIQIGKKVFRVVDTPGQSASAADRLQALREVSAKPYGVINVVSYGYHEYRADLRTVFGRGTSIAPQFLSRHREIEMEQLNAILPQLEADANMRWFLTVINKADLWWADRVNVFAHYQTGPYADLLSRLVARGGLASLEYSSVNHPFYGKAPTDGTFSDVDRRRAREQLLASMITAVARPT